MSQRSRGTTYGAAALATAMLTLALGFPGGTPVPAAAAATSEGGDYTLITEGNTLLLVDGDGEPLASVAGRTPGSLAFDPVTTDELGNGVFVASVPGQTPTSGTATKGAVRTASAAAAQTSTTSTTASEDYQLAYVTSQKGVTLSWPAIPGAVSDYVVYRDGVQLSTRSTTTFTDTTGVQGQNYTYEVSVEYTYEAPPAEGEAPGVGASSLPGDEPATTQTGTIEPSVGEPDNATTTGLTMGVKAARLSGAQTVSDYEGAMAASAAATTRTYLRYTTFIAQKVAESPAVACGKTLTGKIYFAGDNRGYSTTSNSYKTRVTLTFDWPNAKVNADRSVHDTVNTTSTGREIARKNAGNTGIKVTVSSKSTSQAKVTVNHSVGNPFCGPTAITYNLRATVKRSGAYTLSGEHRRAPHHEMYIGTPASGGIKWSTVYQFAGTNFSCLQAGFCTLALFDKSKS